VPLRVTRKQSIALGLGLLGSFFALSIGVIISRSASRIPANASLSKEEIEGPTTPSIETPLAPNSTPGPAAGFVLNEFHRSLVRDGKTLWEVFGKKGRYNPLGNVAEVEEPRLTVSRDEDGNATLSASKAVLTLKGTELASAELFENVVMTYKDDTTMRTSHAIFDQATNTVQIPTQVEIDSKMFTIVGNCLDADLDTQEFKMTKGVKTVIKPREVKQSQ
jgi:LPS export ABC transporter protein LptC